MEKKAVDATAKAYWSGYLGQLGEMWVREIPRRIKAALKREIQATTLEGTLKPLAHEAAKDGTLSLEAAFTGKVDNRDARILITAEFNGDGELKSFDTTRIS